MKRDIKFRAWDKDSKQMDLVVRLEVDDFGHIDTAEGYGDVYHNFELMEYTGMKDKNGREIYEGDIVKYHLTRVYGEHYDPITLGYVGSDWSVDADIFGKVSIWPSNGVMMTQIITSDADMFCRAYPVPRRWHVNQECEIIGNIYENPELLEAQHE